MTISALGTRTCTDSIEFPPVQKGMTFSLPQPDCNNDAYLPRIVHFQFSPQKGHSKAYREEESYVKLILGAVLALCLLCAAASAQAVVSLKIARSPTDSLISPGFIGLSFETGSLRYDHYRKDGYFFDSADTQLLTIFRNLGIESIRIGGDSLEEYTPSRQDIDALFRFVKAANIRVIYSLPLATGSPDRAASVAKYIWDRYRNYLICFSIGNEPNSYKGVAHGFAEGKIGNPEITNYASYLSMWNRYAAAVAAAVPEAKLGGPDSGNGAVAWTAAFAQAEVNNRNVRYILSHYESGGPSRGKTTQQLIDEMLSQGSDAKYQSAYDQVDAIIRSLGYSYLFSETNTHVASRASKAAENHSFATALFALDYLHWWAAHYCSGALFHTGLGSFNAALYSDRHDDYALYPLSYGIAAFNVGGHGKIDSLQMDNPDRLNITAYAVIDAKNNLFVTIVNKEHGEGARDGLVRINAIGQKQGVIYLKAPNHDVTETSGITLAGASIDGNAHWQANWAPLDSTDEVGTAVKIGASSAAIIKFTNANILSPAGQ